MYAIFIEGFSFPISNVFKNKMSDYKMLCVKRRPDYEDCTENSFISKLLIAWQNKDMLGK